LLIAGLGSGAVVEAAQPLGCLIEPRLVVELGSPVIGVLEDVRVDRGAPVRKGQVLATLRSDVEKAAADVAKSRAQAAADVQAALVNRDYNKQRLVRAEDLVKKNFIAAQALEQARTEYDVAEQKLAQAHEQKRIWDHEHNMARAQLSLRSLVSPINGVVVDRYLSPGERVEDKPVMKLADTNPLRVEVFMPAASFRDIEPGMSAKVLPDLPNAGEHAAKVVLVDRIIDPASNTFRVRLELPNPGNALPAGLRCKVAIGDQLIGAANGTNTALVPVANATTSPVVAKVPPANAPTQPAPVAAAEPAPKAAPPKVSFENGVLEAVEHWRQAWTNKDAASYLAAYVPDFRGASPSREAWVKQRQARLGQPGSLEVGIGDARVEKVADDKAQVRFTQQYRSAGYRDETVKTLQLALRNGKWLIEEELADKRQ
jgi:membrane fusion protein, heavy metal efflux system